MLGIGRRLLSEENQWRLQILRHTLRRLRKGRLHRRECNICGFRGLFHPHGWPIRPEARCPSCRALERHRLAKLWFDQQPHAFRGKRVLHFAPEPAVRRFIEPVAAEYVTADIKPGRADLQLDIEALAVPDASFEVVICSHVLEHVDDKLALSHVNRILKPGGFAVIMTPVVEGWARTFENPGISDPDEREFHFGQADHRRIFGADIRSRIAQAGFRVEEFTADGLATSRYGIGRGAKIFIASR
jgi:hypothetical protein